MADICPKCNGNGWYPKLDLMKGRTERIPCMECKMTGYAQNRQANGVRVGRSESVTYFWQFLQFYRPVATLEIRVKAVVNNVTGLPTYKENPFSKKKRIPRMYVEIARMNTKPEWLGRGIMTHLLYLMLGDKKVEWAETSLEDSTPEGIAFLKKRGFKEEGNKLIWETSYGKIKGPGGKDYKPRPIACTDVGQAGSCGEPHNAPGDKQQGISNLQAEDADTAGKVVPFRDTKRKEGVRDLPQSAGTPSEPQKDSDRRD